MAAERTSPTPGSITVGCPQHGGRKLELFCYACGEYKCIKRGECHHSHDYKELDEAFLVTTKRALMADVGKKSTALLQVNTHPTTEECPITCELVSELTGTRVECNTERRGQSQYQISYQPTIKGRHQLHIKVEGSHICGSPFPVAVRSPVEKIGTPILTIGEMSMPNGVAVTQRGEVVVIERDGGCVTVFSPKGERLRSFVTHSACGVVVDGMGCILVMTNSRVLKFTADLGFLTAVSIKGSGPSQFVSLYGIVYNASNDKVYVGDMDRIHVLNSDLSHVSDFSISIVDGVDLPHLSCDCEGNVYVCDQDASYIYIFTANGKFLRRFGGDIFGVYVAGMAIDSNNRVYVLSSSDKKIHVFTSEGQPVTSIGRKGSGPGEFDGPTGLAVDDYGVLYACDFENNCVHVF